MIIANLWSNQIESISSSKSNIAYIYLVCVCFLKMKLNLLSFSINYIYKYVNECSLKISVVGLARLLKLGFVTATSVFAAFAVSIKCYIWRIL